MQEFSDDLIEWVIRYYKEKYNATFDRNQANQTLHDLAGFYEAFEGLITDKDERKKQENKL